MKAKLHTSRARRKYITAYDVGRYLKNLAALHRDQLTGNPEMSEALQEIAEILMAAKASPASSALTSFVDQKQFVFEERLDFSSMSLDEAQRTLSRSELSRQALVALGAERFGMAKSRLQKVSREEIINLISAAMEHERSIEIISDEARRRTRTS